MSADHKKFLSTKEAGQIVGRSSDYVAKLVREGRVSGKRIGRSWVVDEDSLRTHFDAHIAQVEVKKEKLSLERQAEYKAAQTPQKIIERSLVKIGNRLPISAEAFVGMTLSLLAVFGGYSLMHASGLAHLPTKLFESIHEVALSVNRNVAAVSHAPRSSKGSDYVATQDVPEKLSGSEAMIPAVSLIDDRYTYVAPQDVFAATYVPTRPELSFSPRSLVDGYVGIGVGISNLAHGSVGAYVSLVDSLGKEAFYSARIVWSLAQNVTDVLVGGYVGGVTTFASVAQSVPQAYEAFVYEFVDASFTVATTLGTAPYVIGDQIVTGASVVPSTANALGSGLRTNVPTFSENLGTGYVALIENFVFATYRLTDMYADAIEGAGSHIADVYFLVRFDIPAQAWMSAKGAYEVSVQYAKEEIHAAGAYIAQKTTIPVIVLVTNTSGDIREVAQEQVGVFEQKFEDSLSRVQLAQVEGATSFFSRVRSGIQNLFGGKSDPVLFVNPGPAQTDVVIREEAPAPQQPRNITQNFYASTDVSRNYVDSSIRALHEALTAQFQSLSQANRNQIVQNIETIQLINRIEDISDTIIRRPEILGGFLRDIEITGSSKFSGTRVRSDEFIGGTANFATTTLSNLTVNGDTTFTGTLTVGGLTTTGPLSAPYFTATSSTATSTFAGSFAIDTDGFVYATSTGNVGIGVLSPQALLSLRNATNTQAILTLSNAAGTEVGRFTDGGNFGIGTTSPYEKLSVDGNGVFTGSLAAATTTLSGRLTGTDAIFTNATITAATTTNFYSSVLRALSSTLTNLTATNATTTNATSTNFYTSVLNAITGSVTNLTATNATSTNLAISSLTSGRIPYATTGGRLIDSSALTFDGTTVTATDLIATRATTTNATSTNLSVSGVLNLSGLTASRALFLDGSGNVAISGASSLLASSLTDETGTGSVVFSASPTLTGTATLANFIATNGTTTNATSTNLYVSGQTRLGSLTGLLKSTSGVVSAITSSAGLAGEISDETGSGSLVFAGAPTLTSLTVSSGGIGVTGNSTIAGTLSSLTGLSSSGTITFSGLTANRLVATDGSSNLTNSISSANIAASITDETGTGSVVFSASPTLTGTATLANFIATNGTTTNATSTNLAVSSALRLPNLTASRLVALTAGGALTNSDIASWVAGTSNQITVADDGDGSITLSLPSQLSFTNFTATNGTTTNATSTNFAISSLTSGRIPYATTGGRLIDSSALTFDGTTVTATDLIATRATTTNATSTTLFTSTLGVGSGNYFTSLLGNGLVNNSGALSVSTSSLASGFFLNGGNSFGGTAVLGTNDSNNLEFETGGTTRVTINTSGNVGVGTSTSMTRRLTVSGASGQIGIRPSTSSDHNEIIFENSAGTAIADILSSVSDNTFGTANGGLGFFTGSSFGAPRVVINSSGGVGVGTTTPWGKLSVTNTGSGPSFVVEDAASPDSTPFIIDASGNVGVGTAAPADKLHVVGNIYTGTADSSIYKQGSGNLNIQTNTGDIIFSTAAGGTEVARVDASSGYFGIGTNDPRSKLQVNGQTGIIVSNTDVDFASTGTYGQISLGASSGNTYTRLQGFNSGGAVGGNLSLNPLGGNVGIGTTTPQTGLHFYNESTNAIARIESGASSIAGVQLKQVGTTTQWLLESGRQGVNDFNIYQGNGIGAAFTITNAGNVGIGTTTPSAKLAITASGTGTGRAFAVANSSNIEKFIVLDNGNVGINAQPGLVYGDTKLEIASDSTYNANANNALVITNATSPNKRINFGYDSAVDAGYIQSQENSFGVKPLLLNAGGGNVGIGTTTPARPLHVVGAIAFGDSAGQYGTISTNATTNNTIINSWNNIQLQTGGTDRVYVNGSTGNVGIGTTTADARLDLVGSGFPLIINSTNSNGLKLKWEDNGTVAGYAGASTVLGHSFYVGDTNATTQFVVNNSTGNVGINDTTPTEGKLVVNGGSGVGIYASTARTDVSQGVGHLFSTTFNLSTDIGVYGENHTTSAVVTGGTNATVYGNFSQGYVNISGGATLGSNNVFFARNATSGASPTGTVTGSATFYIDETSYQHTGTASLTFANNYGLYVGNQGAVTTGVTKTNAYGVYIAAQSGASNNYALYSAGTSDSYFAGDVGIGVTSPDAKLEVRTTGVPSTDGLIVRNGTDGHYISLRPSMSAGANNSIVQSGDQGIIYTNGTQDTGAFVIAPWATGTSGLRLDALGRLGIGQTDPTNLLHVGGTTSAGRNFQVDSLGRMSVRFDDNSAQPSAWFINRGVAAVGNGATIQFQLADSGSSAVNAGYIGAVSENATYSGTTADSALVFRTAADGNDVEHLRITSAGRVGIGTTTPTAKLEVKDTSLTTVLSVGNSYAVSGGDTSNVLAQIFTNQAAGNYAGLYVARGGNSGTYLTQIANGLNIGPTANGATTPYIYVGAAAGYQGRIGIGDATPGAKLQVALDNSAFTPGNGWDNKTALFGGTGSSASGFGIAHDTTNGTRLMSIEPGVAWRAIDFAASNYSFGINGVGDSLVINSSGNVGIGTTTPVSTLAVDGTFSVTGASNTGFWISEIAGLTTFLGLNSTATTYNPLSLRSHSQTQLYLDTTGNVGIGTADPDARLDVAAASNGTPSLGSAAYYSQIWQNFSGGYGLGVNVNASTGIVQLQSQRFDATATAYDIALNPLGGKVGISTSTPKAQFHIDAGTSASAGDATLLISGNGNATSNASLVLQSLDDQSGRAMGTFYHSHSTGTEWFAGRSFNASTNFEFGYASTASHSSGTSNTTNRVVAIGNTGLLGVKTLGGATANDLCYDTTTFSGLNTLSTCSSSERYKENITNLSFGGLDTVLALRAVEFDWIGTGEHDLGFVAEEVEALNPLLATYKDGVIEGVKYKQLTSVLVSAIQEIVGVVDITQATGTAITIDSLGNVGIGTTSPTYKVHVLGDVAATSFVNISTREQKKGITYFDEARKETVLDKLETIKIAEYRYEYESDNNPLRLGLIAEEAPQEILAVGGKGVDIYKLATFTLASVQALATRVDSLEERVAALEAQGMIPGQGGGVFSTTTLKSAFAELGILIEKGFAQFDKLAFRQLIAEKDNDGQAAAGTGTILAGNKLVLVENNQIKASSKVFITFTSPVVGSWFITDKANGSFRVTLAEVQGSDVTFDYFIVQTERPQTPTSNTGVVDTEAPVITLLGANPLYLALNTPFSDPGATVTDNVDQNLSYELFIDGYPAGEYEIDTSTKSEHVLTYKVLDTAGNLTTVTRGVFVGSEATLGSVQTGTTTPTTTGSTTPATTPATTTPPVVEEEEAVEEVPADTIAPTITLSGKAAIKITVGSTFTDPGATATDDVDGDLTSSITVSGSVDTTKAGTYTLTYTVQDVAGNTGTASRVVTVQAQQTTGTSTPQQ